MNPDLRAKLESNLSSYKDITAMLSTPEIYSDRTKMKSLNQELTKLEASVKLYQKYLDIEKSISGTRELLIDDDKEMIAIAQDELKKYEIELREVEIKIIEATHTAELSYNFGRKVRNLFEQQEFKDVFPEVKLAEDGEILVRGQSRFLGYLTNDKGLIQSKALKLNQPFDDEGWFASCDLGEWIENPGEELSLIHI